MKKHKHQHKQPGESPAESSSPANQPSDSNPIGGGQAQSEGAALRWKQIQDLLLGEYEETVQARFQSSGDQWQQAAQALSAKFTERMEAMAHEQSRLSQALESEVGERKRLEGELNRVRNSQVARKDLASKLRKWADKLAPDGESGA